MRSDGAIRTFILLLTVALLLTLTTCAGGRDQSSDRSGGQPQHRVAPPFQAAQSLDKALVELEGMECPQGVDEELWRELKDALGEALVNHPPGRRGSLAPLREEPGWLARPTHGVCKFVSAPPVGPANRVTDLSLIDHGDATYTLTWRYQNLGDYDQNGTVGISDITPLAIHFGEAVPTGDAERNSLEAVIDGSRDSVISIADVTPIAINFGIDCAGYSLRSAASHPEGVEETSELATAAFSLAEGEERKGFSSAPFVAPPRSYVAVAPFDAEGEFGELSNAVMIPNYSPVAQLVANPPEGDAPLDVEFDASGSYDLEGAIVRYEWDWEGDGVYDHDSGNVPTAEHTYDVAEVYDPQVRVTDEHNATGTASVTVWAGRWRIAVVLDGLGIFHEHTSLEVVNGHPAIGLWGEIIDPGGGEFAYVRANDANGETWGSPVLVHESLVYHHNYCDNSLVVVNGHPVMACADNDQKELVYARANDADGSTWGTPMKVDDAETETDYILSMAIVNGHPAIAYEGSYEGGGGYLLYVRANDANGVSWGSPILPCPRFAGNPALLVVNGKPVMCYGASGGWMYVRANDANGETWGNPTATGLAGGSFLQMALVNGNPAICYAKYVLNPEFDDYDLMYARALDANGNAWGTPLTLDSEGNVGQWCSLAVIHGYPAISYLDATNDSLKYVRAFNADGSSWRTPVTVDNDDVDFGFPSLRTVNGHPAISYLSSNELRFAIYY